MSEVENVGPGISRDLVIQAQPGTYVTACKPGMTGDGIRGQFTVTGDPAGTGDVSRQVTAATTTYTRYVKEQTAQLLAGTKEFAAAYSAGDDRRARELYAPTRWYWESIEPVAESFGDLDPRLDLREADLEEGQKWTGWHRIEKDLWPPRDYAPLSQKQRQQLAEQLVADTEELAERVDTPRTRDRPDRQRRQGVAGRGGHREGDRRGGVLVTHGLVRLRRQCRGAKVMVSAVRPILQDKDPELLATLDRRFDTLQGLLDQYREGRRVRVVHPTHSRAGEGVGGGGGRSGRAVVAGDFGGDRVSVSRRGFLGLAGAGVVVAGAGVAVGRAAPTAAAATDTYPFYGPHQAGILTPAQDRLHFATFDLTTDRRTDLIELLRRWTEAAARMTRGESAGTYGPMSGPYDAPPDDTGEAFGLPAAGLTITVGFGASLFDRFGLRDQRPDALIDLPRFPGDALEPSRCGETSRCRPARTIPRSPSTQYATWPGSVSAPRRCAGRNWVLDARPAPAPVRTLRATCSASGRDRQRACRGLRCRPARVGSAR